MVAILSGKHQPNESDDQPYGARRILADAAESERRADAALAVRPNIATYLASTDR